MRRFPASCTIALLLFAFIARSAAAAAPVHPLDPLSADEINAAARIIRTAPGFPADALFSTIVLHEPSKDFVLSFHPGMPFGREAFAIVMDRPNNRTFEAIADLRAEHLLSWKEIPRVQPQVFIVEYDRVPAILKADPRWQEAMRIRGISPDSVQIDTWAAGDIPKSYHGRLLRALTYYKGKAFNFYGRPIEGVTAIVDMNTRKVVEFHDAGIMPLPPRSQELDTASIGKLRPAPAPLGITQPQGAGFLLQGNELRWQGWHLRFSMHPREGLVLHTVGYEDGGRERPVLYRGSLSEMVVPYADPDSNWRWRSAFDVGEYGVGRLSSPLEANIDAPANATLLDAVFADDSGKAYTLPRVVGIYERDGGILWKHFDTYSGANESRRARELVLFFVASIGNYDYSISWIFHQDGGLEVDAGLTGIMLPKGVSETASHDHSTTGSFGHLVSPNIVAPHHQHYFCFRLDMDVDGVNNSVAEVDSRPLPRGKMNPTGSSFAMEEMFLPTERTAARSLDVASSRAWKVFNTGTTNALGHHCGYALVPGANAVPFAATTSSVRKRAGFISNHFWATRYHESEMNAAGAYPSQSAGGDGLPRWIADNESIDNTDVVLWYTMGITHIPRPEEWPIMTMTHIGFRLLPVGFFARNPALDVPR
ncbi:MAG TPA: primary-amine oxidase [Candidatus Kapabacteria bacterium]|nr:primary-amine oxidase [Candidatus Kapabacteria bacterium]